MPKGQLKKTTLKESALIVTLLLAKIISIFLRFILMKIGNIPIIVTCYILAALRKLFKLKIYIPNLKLKISKACDLKVFKNFKFLRLSRKRGRPKRPLFSKPKVAVAFFAFLIFLGLYTIFILGAAYQLPSPTRIISPQEPLTSEFYDRNGQLLYRLYEGQNRSLVKLPEIPRHLIQATIAIEDQNFYSHVGIDIQGIFRALYKNFKTGTKEGASTITQQLIKNSLLTPEKSYSRKIKEIILALWAERIYTKAQILQMYFNEAPYGGSVVGIGAASQTYFGKSPQDLSLAQSAYLAGLPASPTQLSPYGSFPELVKLRQKDILSRMVKEKYITQSEADKAYLEDLQLKPPVNNIKAPHFVFYIRDLLAEKYGPRIVAEGGLKIYTTLDLKLQEEVEKIVKEEIDNLENLNVKNGAAMVTDAETGQILAMVGSRDYHYPGFGNFNVTLSLRQPGSSIKPVTYTTAFKQGFSPSNIILDIPVTFKDEWGNQYSPVNYDGKFRGPVTLRQALGSSLNIPAVKLLYNVGIDNVVQTAKDLGITTFNNPKRFGLALTLGGAETKMIEMMGVYGAFSRNGIYHAPAGILKITDSKNQILEEYADSPKQALSPQIAYLITNILSDNIARSLAFGTNSLLRIPNYEVGVKTGTSDNKRDNWTFGYTPKFVVGVWVGNPDNSPMNPSLTSGVTGAAPIWNKIMHKLLDGTKPLAFERPSGITETTIDNKKDLSISGVNPKSLIKVQKKEDNNYFYSDQFSTPQGIQANQANPAQPNL